jgi:hypothetical protein
MQCKSDEILKNYGGVERNSLNNLIVNNDDIENIVTITANSPYIDTENIVEYMKPFRDKFSILNLNVQSINAKFDKLLLVLTELHNNNFEFSAICMQETWLKNDDHINLFQIPNYRQVSLPASFSSHGGLMIYVHERFQFKLLELYQPTPIYEGIFIEISGKYVKNRIILGNIYRPPRDSNSDIESFIELVHPILSTLKLQSVDTVIAGDFNIDLLQSNIRKLYADVLDEMYTHSFVPTINLPTRFSRRRATLIDQMYFRPSNLSSGFSHKAGIIFSDISDHLPTILCIDQNVLNIENNNYVKVQTFNQNSVNGFKQEISGTDFTQILDTSLEADPTENYRILQNILVDAKHKHFPVKFVRFNKYKHKKNNWITFGIIRALKNRDKMYRNLKTLSIDSPDYVPKSEELKERNKVLQKCIRAAKNTYYSNQFEKYKNDSKKTWDTIKSVLNLKQSKSDFPHFFMINDVKVCNKSQIAQHFNTFFTSIGPQLASKINSSNKLSFHTYLKGNINSRFTFIDVSPEEVSKTIRKMKSKTSTDVNELSMNLIKEITISLSFPLSKIINQSFHTGIFPEPLKIAKVIPIYKQDDIHSLNNYRPISILPVLSKIFERIVFNQLYEYFQHHKLFYISQHGFRKLHSTETATLEFIDSIFQKLDNDEIPFSIFLDLSKAFDTLNHDILLTKLSFYGIKNTPLLWFKNYLKNRMQYVQLDDTKSTLLPISTGVPQGSILGPLLFIIYMNDISEVSNKFEAILYADDTSLTSTITTFDLKAQNININLELKRIHDWLCVNELSLNIKKTKYMIFRFPQRQVESINFPVIQINDSIVDQVTEFKFLGTYIDETLNWKAHIRNISRKISRNIGILNRFKHVLPPKILLQLYNSLILPHLTYSLSVWGFSNSSLLKFQKKAARIISRSKYNAHCDPIFRNLNIIKVNDLFHLSLLNIYYKYSNDELPGCFSRMLAPIPPSHNYTMRPRPNNYQKPNKASAKYCIRYYIPKVIQMTPDCILSKIYTHSRQGFCQYIKLVCLSNYKDKCEIPNCYICQN